MTLLPWPCCALAAVNVLGTRLLISERVKFPNTLFARRMKASKHCTVQSCLDSAGQMIGNTLGSAAWTFPTTHGAAGSTKCKTYGVLPIGPQFGKSGAKAPVGLDRDMEALMSTMWRTPSGNIIKVPFWRLLVDAIPTAARRHAGRESCVCGVICPDRAHHFWA